MDKYPSRMPHMITGDGIPHLKLPAMDPTSQIRLISLLPPRRAPGPDSMDSVQCTLDVHTLTKSPPYEALSYAWGGMDRQEPLEVVQGANTEDESLNGEDDDSTVLFATPQLVMALARLRLHKPRLLWIDQLCIDQESVEEKGAQIQLMAEIYTRATRVVIWLGEPFQYPLQDGDSAHIRALIDAVTCVGGPPSDSDDVQRIASVARFERHHPSDECGRRVNSARGLLGRPWFTRAWVFQEASLARELAIQFGKETFRFEDLLRVGEALDGLCRAQGLHRDHAFSIAITTGGHEMMKVIQQTRAERGLVPEVGGAHAHVQEAAQPLLWKLLCVMRRVQCSKQQDRIFAFLAFQNDEGITASADAYNRPVEETWRMAAEKIIQASKSLDILAAASGGAVQGQLLPAAMRLPSWVPNWANPFPNGRPFITPTTRFRASRDMAHEWAPQDDPRKLRVRGKVIDRVQALLSAHNPADNFQRAKHSVWLFSGIDLLEQAARVYLNFGADKDTKDRLGDYSEVMKQKLRGDISRVLLADGALGPRQPLTKMEQHQEYMEQEKGQRAWDLRYWQQMAQRRLSDEEKVMVAEYEFIEDLVLVAEAKRLFYTDQLQLGMAPKVVQVGDVVAILHGSKTPCLLRKVESSEAYSDAEYRILGQCYLGGWMFGNSPRGLFGRDPKELSHPGARWWEEQPDEFILV